MAQIKKRSDKRQRRHRVHVRLTAEELRVVQANASNTGLTTASLMRELATGYTPTSVIDQKHILDLIHLRGDMGRLGGLLKQWLGESETIGPRRRREINQWRDQVLENQAALRLVIDQIKSPKS